MNEIPSFDSYLSAHNVTSHTQENLEQRMVLLVQYAQLYGKLLQLEADALISICEAQSLVNEIEESTFT